ncbi:TorF family putative porin [Pseudorhodobacter ferrugineus]|uniref:TorF family putative porin n=1 Tax=Pseudorhodobacter ferrugineus TaxID=77008 RepID=UPI0003B42B43|nr:TorF family putative porin [Pseudorhodobacter ferrugineus]
MALRILSLSAALIGLATVSTAQSVEVTAGLGVTSNYISNGHTLSNDKPAVQGYIEGSFSGFYGGIWMSSLNDGTDNTETDLSLGYRNELPNGLGYDIGYTRYLYNNSGNCCGEFALGMDYSPSDVTTVGGSVSYDPGSKVNTVELTGDYALNDQFSLSGSLGKVQHAQTYADLGVSYSLNDTSTVDMRYHDANDARGRLVVGLAFDTSLFSR